MSPKIDAMHMIGWRPRENGGPSLVTAKKVRRMTVAANPCERGVNIMRTEERGGKKQNTHWNCEVLNMDTDENQE